MFAGLNGKNVAAGTLSLSQGLYGGAGTRAYTFTRYRYAFDFSGVRQVDRFYFMNVEFGLDGIASGVMLPPQGGLWSFRDCYFTRPKDRGITSIGTACQGMVVDRCEFLSNEMSTLSQNRTSVAINVNANDTKIRHNRFVRFGHFMVAAGGGRIINFSTSVFGVRAEGYAVYSATKAGIEVMTQILSREMRGRNVTVNAVAPGPTATELFLKGKSEQLIDHMAKFSPMERLGTPEDIAGVVSFLAGPDGAWINGQVLRANGGMT